MLMLYLIYLAFGLAGAFLAYIIIRGLITGRMPALYDDKPDLERRRWPLQYWGQIAILLFLGFILFVIGYGLLS